MKKLMVLAVLAVCFAAPAFSQIQVGGISRWKVSMNFATDYFGPSVSNFTELAFADGFVLEALAAREEDL